MEGVQALGPLIKNESRNISSQMQRDGRTLNQNISHLENQMGASFLSQTSQLERIEAHLANRLQDERLRRVEEIMAGLELTDPPGRHVRLNSPFHCLDLLLTLPPSMTVPRAIWVVLSQSQIV
jgi:hypothetical protein